jgi:hypothetical protein
VQLKESGVFNEIDLPGRNIVLLGRGKTVQNHLGNMKMHKGIESTMEEYQQARKLEKKYVALEVIVLVRKYGGRFLKRNPDGWWEKVSD